MWFDKDLPRDSKTSLTVEMRGASVSVASSQLGNVIEYTKGGGWLLKGSGEVTFGLYNLYEASNVVLTGKAGGDIVAGPIVVPVVTQDSE